MKRKIAVLISLLVFFVASTAQASDADPKSGTLSPLPTPIGQTTPVRVFTRQAAPRVEIMYQGVGMMLVRMR